MRPSPETIRLGRHEWLVRPLTLRQVQEIEPVLVASPVDAKGNIAAAMAIVQIALRRDYPDAADSLAEIEATAPEIGAAMSAILQLGGFIDAADEKDANPGEACAGAINNDHPPASNSGLFTQES